MNFGERINSGGVESCFIKKIRLYNTLKTTNL